METFCSQCGHELPRSDAHFCNHCGASRMPSGPATPSWTGLQARPQQAAPQPESAQSVFPNQPAVASPVTPLPEQPPAWMDALQRGPRHQRLLRDMKGQIPSPQQQETKAQHELPAAGTQGYTGQSPQSRPAMMDASGVGVAPGVEQATPAQGANKHEQLDFPLSPSTPQVFSPVVPQSLSPARELHVKIWRDANSSPGEPVENMASLQQGISSAPPIDRQSVQEGERPNRAVEDLPTSPVESIAAAQPAQPALPAADIPTTPLLALPSEQGQGMQRPDALMEREDRGWSNGDGGGPTDVAAMSTLQLQVQGRNPALSPAPSRPGRTGGSLAPQPPRFRDKKKRLPLLIGGGAALLLLVLALGSWIVILQPFPVSSVTDVQQSFTNTRLGISLRYPNGWKQPQVDYGKKSILLQDASDTAQISIRTADPTSDTLESYLQKQAAQSGISNAKPGPNASFAASSWQVIQGDEQVKGAEYTCVLFATIYKNHLYVVTQLAPRTVYADEEKLVFSPTRQSLRFL